MRNQFQRARSDDERQERREAIERVAVGLLDEVRVHDLTLTELARRAGLAKSNVLRYVGSREALLLDIYDREYRSWLEELRHELAHAEPSTIESVALAIADTLIRRPRLCELAANAPGVLEQNVSGEVAARYKTASIANARTLAEIIGARLGAFSEAAAIALVSAVNLGMGGIWAATQPSPGMAAAYASHPELGAYRHDLRIALREFVATILTGLAHREPTLPFERRA